LLFKVAGNENVEIVFFRAHHRQKWIDFRQTKTDMISGPAEMFSFVLFVCLYGMYCGSTVRPRAKVTIESL